MNNNLPLPAAKVEDNATADRHKSSRTTTTTAPYTGQWTSTEAVHLLKRTMFGTTKADVDHVLTLTMSQAVDELLNNATSISPPLNNYNVAVPDPNVALGATWVNDSLVVTGTVDFQRKKSLQAWWIGNMLGQNISLEQKMTLFWHNHFSTQLYVYDLARFGYQYIETIRTNAMGNFRTLLKAMTLNPAMLNYLNGYLNTKTAPDENYGREMQELFTVGKGPNSLYTEADVKAAARVLTGYKYTASTMVTSFVSNKHDASAKQFSAFYNNTIINNTGNGGADELDDLITMILNTDECAKYLCRRLYRFFVYYDIDSTVETNIITPLAAVLRNSNYDIKTTLSTLFKSEHFYDTLNQGCFIKPPVDYFVGMFRQMGVVFPDNTNLANQYYMWNYTWGFMTAAAQEILNPPNVAGWPAYYQSPEYHELWINSSSLPLREQIADGMIYAGFSHSGQTVMINVLAFTATMSNPSDPVVLISDVLSLLLSTTVSASLQAYLLSILLAGQSTNSYWTSAWTAYVAAPTNATLKATVLNRLQPFYKYIMDLPEYHLQ